MMDRPADKLDALIRIALDAEDVKAALEKGIVTENQVVSAVHTRAKEIWDSASDEMGLALDARRQVEAARLEATPKLKELLEREDSSEPRMIGFIGYFSRMVISYVIVVIGFAIVWILVRRGWNSSLAWLLVWWHATLLIVAVVLAGLGSVLAKRASQALHKRLLTEIKNKRALETKEESKRILAEYAVTEKDRHYYELSKNADVALVQKGVLPSIRSFINESIPSWEEAPYAITLPMIPVPGLAEVFNPLYEIPTEAKEKVLQLFDAMPGGSIAVAGPRGAGKTTLLSTICNGSLGPIKEKPVLTVFSSAPVQYDAREFILHIFSSVCREVLRISGEAEDIPPWRTLTQIHEPSRVRLDYFRFLSRILRRSSIVALLLASIAFSLSIFLAVRTLNRVPPENVNQTTGITDAHPRSRGLIDVFELKSSTFLGYSLWLLIFAITSFYLRRLLAEMIERHYRSNEPFHQRKVNTEDPKLALKTEARRWREEIRFQQSFSSGWSGSLKLPIGLEGNLNAAASLAKMQLSLPEIVEGYRNFITLASTQYQVIIAIDELDKIESDEKAQQFLNEIKAIFGLERCFYLVSVSESALNSFERRGLPFRDAFDSAFDDMVRVDYLDWEAAKRLLHSRVIGLPISFVTFCYCWSGGLARDLLRACRALFQQAIRTSSRDLFCLIQPLVIKDLQAKIRAAIGSASALDSDLERAFLQHLLSYSAQLGGDGVDSCRKLLCEYVKLEKGLQQEPIRGVGQDPHRRQSLSLLGEIAVYTYYVLTLMEVFNLYKVPNDWRVITGVTAFDELASIRQNLSPSIMSARSALSSVRLNCKLDVPEFGRIN